MLGMDPLHELRPSTLIHCILVQWLAFTDEYPKLRSGSNLENGIFYDL
jgi:hypothetical protein